MSVVFAWGVTTRWGSVGVGRLSPLRGEFLFFACPKKRNQKKGHPDVRADALRAPVPGRSVVLGAGFHTTSLSCGSLSRPSWPLTPARDAAPGAAIGAPESKAKAPSPRVWLLKSDIESLSSVSKRPSPASGRGAWCPSPRPRGEGARRADEGKLLPLTLGPLCAAPRRAAASGLSGADCLSGAAASFSDGRRGEHRTEPLRSSGAEARGVLSFAYFSLHKQRKVGRLTRRKASYAKQVKKASCN